ncbi:MAG: hypothetical protein HY822_07530 [Acidobacteria bacterium]|nr:hypothetical protein [Acidobacteriota bacterium]
MRLAACVLLLTAWAHAEMKTIPVAQAGAGGAWDPAAPLWKSVPAVAVALQRTPLLFPTDAPAALEIASVQVRMARVPGGTVVRLEWEDKTEDAGKPAQAVDRFPDTCAIMIPASGAAEVNPSLQMGDAAHPVRIYFYDSTRGAAVMEASGRETTKRTGATFPVHAQRLAGKWAVALHLPEMAAGTPIAVAIWNGAQQDRDGRKYFSVWYKTQ